MERKPLREQNCASQDGAVSSRRDFLGRLASLSAGLTVAGPLARGSPPPIETAEEAPPRAEVPAAAGARSCTLQVNGKEEKLSLDTRTTLLDALRDRLGLMGTKKGCDRGACGACTVHIDDTRVLSCLTLAVMVQGKKITTIEGLANGERLHPVQSAFIACDGFQCGYCTPGQIMSAVGCIREGRAGSTEEIREFMSGNLCRCGAYPNIVDAVKMAAADGRFSHDSL